MDIDDEDKDKEELDDEKIIYVVPSNAIIEHLEEIIKNNPNLDRQRDFSDLEFWTYQKLIKLSREEFKNLKIKLLIVDEFHHIGAPVWGSRIEEIVRTHLNMKVFGMTAYTIRDRGTLYERDMVNPDTNELFSNKVVSRYDIVDAMIDGVLPKPIYKSAKTKLYEFASELEEKVLTSKSSKEDKEKYQKILKDVKARITEAPTIKELIKQNVKPNSKCIYFCPPGSVKGVNDIETIKQELLSWFKEYIPEEDIIIYTTTSEMGEEGKRNRDAFYNDLTLDGENAEGKLRVMLAINQYNEGPHSKNVDTVILGRSTSSDIVYFEQIGRINSVKGNITQQFDEYEKYTIEKLKDICKEREIPISDNASKIDIIERLLAPTIIDLTDNYEFIKQLETNLKERVKEYQKQGTIHQKRIRTFEEASFDVEVLNQDLFEMLKYVRDRLTLTWEDKYELAKAYYNHYGNLEIPHNFKTINGIDEDENGIVLGIWIKYQRQNQKKLTEKRRKLLEEIGMRFETKIDNTTWEYKYELAKAYYNHYGNLEIPQNFKTLNGIDYDDNGISLGYWIVDQRRRTKYLTEEKRKLLEEIGMRLKNKYTKYTTWEDKYELAKAYYNHYGNLKIPRTFKTLNGIDEDVNGTNLGKWLANQRANWKTLSKERKRLLEEIGIHIKIRKNTPNSNKNTAWEDKYKLAKAYYNHYGNLKIPRTFKTINGIDYDENGIKLGSWLSKQKNQRETMSKERKNKLLAIGMDLTIRDNEKEWNKKYELAKTYYNHYGNLEIPQEFKTINGIDYDENGITLGSWIDHSRTRQNKLSKKRRKLLEEIHMRFEPKNKKDEWDKKYELAKVYYNHYGNLKIPQDFKTLNGIDEDANGIAIGAWINTQKVNKNNLTEEKIKMLNDIGMIWYGEQTKFITQEITPENTNFVKAQLLTEFKQFLESQKDMINSKEDIDNINNEFNEYVGRRK